MTDKRDILRNLQAQRDMLEVEANCIAEELQSPGIDGAPPAGLKDPLVDKEGYPRGDIDIMKVLEKRKRLSTINYDHKEIMTQIERLVKEVHQEIIQENGIVPKSSSKTHETVKIEESIAIIDEIFPESPAAEAGLVYGDQLLSFGGIDSNYSGDPFTAIPGVVKNNINKEIPLLVKRQDTTITTSITPKTWGGKGLLGLHLTPLKRL